MSKLQPRADLRGLLAGEAGGRSSGTKKPAQWPVFLCCESCKRLAGTARWCPRETRKIYILRGLQADFLFGDTYRDTNPSTLTAFYLLCFLKLTNRKVSPKKDLVTPVGSCHMVE